MGTRSLTAFKQGDEEIVVMYRQFDGYPGGHGEHLADILKGKLIVNGYQGDDQEKWNFNGMPCLAASVVAKMKDGIGAFYLHKSGTRDCGEDYFYTVYSGPPETVKTERGHDRTVCRPKIKCQSGDTVLFDGFADDWDTAKIEAVEAE
jgi:hypothetical protein